MKPVILLAPDKFKGTLSARAVCEGLAAGVLRGWRGDEPPEFIHCPLSDGGEGFVETLAGTDGEWLAAQVHDPLGRVIEANFALRAGRAIIEMSAASGLVLLEQSERDPWRAGTFGTGELILAAAQRGASEILLGIGGSATNDGGIGMAAALGFRFLDGAGAPLPVAELPARFIEAARIIPPASRAWPAIRVACDVTAPLLGEGGATRVFGPQKGAQPTEFEKHERRFNHLVELAARDLGVLGLESRPGSGAAGGLGWGLATFAGATLEPGFEIAATAAGLPDLMQRAGLAITGEGRLDASTLTGKVAFSVAELAGRLGTPCVAVCGGVDPAVSSRLGGRFAAVYSLAETAGSLEEAMSNPLRWLVETAAKAAPILEGLP